MFLQFICLAYLILEFVWVDGMVSVNAFASVGQPGGGGGTGSEFIKKNCTSCPHSFMDFI